MQKQSKIKSQVMSGSRAVGVPLTQCSWNKDNVDKILSFMWLYDTTTGQPTDTKVIQEEEGQSLEQNMEHKFSIRGHLLSKYDKLQRIVVVWKIVVTNFITEIQKQQNTKTKIYYYKDRLLRPGRPRGVVQQ